MVLLWGPPVVKWCPLVQLGRVRLLDWAASPRGKAALTVPNALAARAFVHAEGFVYARVPRWGPCSLGDSLKGWGLSRADNVTFGPEL